MCRANATASPPLAACLTLRREFVEAALCDVRISPEGALEARAACVRWERTTASVRVPVAVGPSPRTHHAANGGSADLNEVLAVARTTLGDVVGERIELNVVAAAKRSRVAADPGRLRALVHTLAVAACKRMPRGGALTIETADTVLDAEFCASYDDVAPGDYVMLAVTDAGRSGPWAEGPARSPRAALAEAVVRRMGGCILRHGGDGCGNTTEVFLPGSGEPSPPARRMGPCARLARVVREVPDRNRRAFVV